jgi:hypothetical protein
LVLLLRPWQRWPRRATRGSDFRFRGNLNRFNDWLRLLAQTGALAPGDRPSPFGQTLALEGGPGMIRSVTFGLLCGTTAALFTLGAGAGGLMAFAAYSAAGSLGLLAMALPGQPQI